MIWNFIKRLFSPATPGGSVQAQASDTEGDSFQPVVPLPSPEDLCGIDPDKMDREEINQLLKMLYKRHNEAAASLNDDLRSEAETMLDAIVECRAKYIDNA